MRRRAALACVTLGLVAGAGTGVGLRTLPLFAAEAPAGSAPTSVAPTAPGPTPAPSRPSSPTTGPATGSPGRAHLVSVEELRAAGPRGTTISTRVTSDEVDPVVSPCQRSGPFAGLEDVVVGRWQGPDGRAGEVVAQAPSVAESRRRANDLYEQHLRCAELAGRTVGARHAITVDGGSVTWFEVRAKGRTGLSAVVRQSDRFAVVYADESQVRVERLPDLLRDAATRLR
jgi:hypothetical protein